jgi:DnaK suppressor protein
MAVRDRESPVETEGGIMEPGGKTRYTGVGDADSLHLQGLPSGCWQEQKLALESEKDETSRTYNLQLNDTSQVSQQPQMAESQSNDLVLSANIDYAELGRINARDKKSNRLAALAARLRQIDEALHRIRTGRFGLCTSCGIEIGRARLDRDLATQYCTLCQAEAEIKGGRYT